MPEVRVAMFLLGDCQNDGRVLKEAATLQRAGYQVRVFGIAARGQHAGATLIGTVPVQRLPAASWPARLWRLAARARARTARVRAQRPSPHGGSDGPRVPSALRDVLLRVHRPTLVLAYTRLAVTAARAWDPDVLHAHDLPALPAAALAARGRRPIIYDSHELWRGRNRLGQWRPLGRTVDALVERALAPRAALVVTVCDSIAARLQRRYRLPRRPVVLRNVPQLPIAATGRDLRGLAGLHDERVLLYTGRVMEGRGLELAIRCLNELPRDVVLVLMGYGDPTYMAALRALATRHGVADRVRLVDPVPAAEVAAVAATADVAYVVVEPVCESYRYALPNKLFEAIAARLPVLASDLPEIRRVVLGYGVGTVFSPGTPGSLLAAFDTVMAGAPRYRRAAERARQALNWGREERVLLDGYAQLINGISATGDGHP